MLVLVLVLVLQPQRVPVTGRGIGKGHLLADDPCRQPKIRVSWMEVGWRLDGGWMEVGWRLDGSFGGFVALNRVRARPCASVLYA